LARLRAKKFFPDIHTSMEMLMCDERGAISQEP